jgi:hypothetical protein
MKCRVQERGNVIEEQSKRPNTCGHMAEALYVEFSRERV